MPHLWGGWIISAQEKCSLTQIKTDLWIIFGRNRPLVYIEKVLDLWVELMKNGGKNKSVVFIILDIYIHIYIYIYIYIYIWRVLFQNAINAKKMSSSCHFAVYWTYSLLHQCFMPNRYISLFKMYLTLLTSQRGALATDAKSCSLWRSLLERPPPVPETRFETCSVWCCGPGGGLTIIV